MELTLSLVREALLGDEDELDRYRTIVETLTDEVDPYRGRARRGEARARGRPTRPTPTRRRSPTPSCAAPRDDRDSGERRQAYDRGPRGGDRGAKGAPARAATAAATSCACSSRSAGPPASAPATSWVPSPARPRLQGRDIGAIEITEKFSLVEVPAGSVDEVIDAMKGATIRGRRVNVRRERFDPR